MENLQWLEDHLDSFDDDEYLILDCPGQLELYTHVPIMRQIIDRMRLWGYESSMVGVFCVDATFLTETSKFLSGSLLSLSAMIALELPHVNVLTKCDLMPEQDVERMLSVQSATEMWDIEQYNQSHADMERQAQERAAEQAQNADRNNDDGDNGGSDSETMEALRQQQQQQEQQQQQRQQERRLARRKKKRHRLTEAICSLLDDYTMVAFLPLNLNDEESISHALLTIDHSVQFGEDQEVYTGDEDVGREEEN